MINRSKLTAAVICSAMLTGSICLNAAGAESAKLCPDFHIVIDGEERAFFSADGIQVYPIVYNGSTYLPLRSIGELMGRNVNWDQSSLTISLSGNRGAAASPKSTTKSGTQKDISVQIRDDFKIVVDGETRTFADANNKPAYPLLYNGSTYLPLRSVGELMGKSIEWNDAEKTVTMGGSLVTDADSFNQGVQKPSTQKPTESSVISVDDAKAKALEHSGVSESEAVFTKQKLDWDDGRQIYEIEFYTSDNGEYEYEIDAHSGDVIKYDQDYYYYGGYHHYNNRQHHDRPCIYGCEIGLEAARKAALAKVIGATVANIKEIELDDGKYEGEIRYNGREYEFEIDAYTGEILKWEIDD